jgi:hypothetical protein
MRTFKEGNWSHGAVCPICKTADEGEVVLIGIDGTEEGGNMQADQVHMKCLQLRISKEHNIIYMRY